MTEAERAYRAAQKAIAKVGDGEILELSLKQFRALDWLPPEIATLSTLRELYLQDTKVADLPPPRRTSATC